MRLHAPALRGTFKTVLGYSLIVESTFARLIKGTGEPGRAGPTGTPPGQQHLHPGDHTHMALLCAALLAPGTGEQTLISALIDQVRSDAATIGVQVGDTLPERRALVTAIGHLISWGVLSETDGTATSWGERRDEALLTIHRAALPHLLARPLSGMSNADDLLAADPHSADQPRRSLRRKLVENPLVRREDLTDAERDVLSRERSELTRVLGENFGLTVEVRAEGALAHDSTGSLTDLAFPGSGTVKQAALLLLTMLIDLCQPTAGTTAVLDNGYIVPGIATTWDDVDRALATLSAQHRRAWGATLVDQPDRLREEVVTLLTDLCLATRTAAGPVIHPAAARYRPQARSAADTRGPAPLRPVRSGDAMTDTFDQTPLRQYPYRWRLSRAGFVNVRHYYENTFDIAGGRLILRGTNGSGKSRALEMLLPFLLDADRRNMGTASSVRMEDLMSAGAGVPGVLGTSLRDWYAHLAPAQAVIG